MPRLTIVASITAKHAQVDLVKSELEKLIAPARAEAGCLQCDLHRDNDDPVRFMFYEQWESRERWQAHMATHHLRDYLSATEGAVDAFTVTEMTHIA